ncbi:MAG: ECF transporter S component [Lachnospiraceae bacterium]
MNHLLLINSAIFLLINIMFLRLFEREKPKPGEILPIVVMCCAASLGRVVFAVIPQVQPVTALVIITGSVYGCRKGYVTGALAALISNLFLGQGPWTLFQMTAWGVVGLLAGVLGHISSGKKKKTRKILFTIYGVAAGFLFSIITDFLTICYLGDAMNIHSVIAVFATGLAFNVGHAVFNGILLYAFYELISTKLYRIKKNS